jgi:hypothetical protein
VQFTDAVHEVKRVELGRYGYGAIDPALALFQGLEHQHAGGEIRAIGGECQRLG